MAQDAPDRLPRLSQPLNLADPVNVAIELVCPSCDEATWIEARLQTRVTRDTDGTGALGLRVRSAKVAHVCDQPSLGLVEGGRER